MQRNADPVTIDHIIDLRKEINRLTKELDEYKVAHSSILDKQILLIKEVSELRGHLATYEQAKVPHTGHRD